MTRSDPVAALVAALARGGGQSSDFDLNPGIVLPENRVLRDAAVLVALDMSVSEPSFVLTKRSSRLLHHPGQIAFPGGKVDPGDADAVAAALREAEEEVGLPRDRVEVLGFLPPHETVTGFNVVPVVARITGGFTPVAEAGEVAEVFHAPFRIVTDPARFSVQSRRWRGLRRHYYTVPWGPYYIWGATARILRSLAERVNG